MMNNVQIFKNSDFGEIRMVVIDNEPWFVGKDVAEALEYANTRDALATHVDKEDKNTVVISDGKRGNPNQTIINESGLYSLILSSKLPNAKKFKRWVTNEVLPSIRKNGGYIANQENLGTEQTLANALLVAQNIIASKDKQIAEMQAIIQQPREMLNIPQLPEICKRSNQPQVCVKEQAMGVLARTLAKQLDCSQNEAIGLIVRFWMWTIKNTDMDGNIQVSEREDIEETLICGQCGTYSGSEAVEALINIGLIEGTNMLPADWSYWQDIVLKDMKRKATDRMRQRAYREQKKLEK